MIEISKFLGTILGTVGTIKWNRDIVKIEDFGTLYMCVGHWDGTQMVPKISKPKNMMSKLSKTLSNVLIRLLEPDFEEIEFL